MFSIVWSPRLPIANLWSPEMRQLTRYLLSILKIQALIPAATNPVLQANTTKECFQRETQSGKLRNSPHTLFY